MTFTQPRTCINCRAALVERKNFHGNYCEPCRDRFIQNGSFA